MSEGGADRRIRIWDRPIRIVHWLFVILIPLAWWTAEEDMFDWHRRIGITMLALLTFRIVWGFVGSSTAQFINFVRGPGGTLAYLRKPVERIGHNPLGAWSVVALLTVMIVQVGLGLFSIDVDGLEGGPLADLISFDAAREAAELHEANFVLLLALIALHLGAILFYAVAKRKNLVAPMLTGEGAAPPEVEPMQPSTPVRLFAAILAGGALAYWVSAGAPL